MLSLERVTRALVDLGLSRLDAEVYVYLAKKQACKQKVVDLAKAMNLSRKKIYDSLKNLQTKGLVAKERKIFSVLPFEEALDLLIKMEKEQTKLIQESKEELLTIWIAKD